LRETSVIGMASELRLQGRVGTRVVVDSRYSGPFPTFTPSSHHIATKVL
jgi:hypothetical protein